MKYILLSISITCILLSFTHFPRLAFTADFYSYSECGFKKNSKMIFKEDGSFKFHLPGVGYWFMATPEKFYIKKECFK